MAGGSMKDIKRRIRSVESTSQITKAMELVASSKLRRAKERALATEPFFNILYQTICEIAAVNNEASSIFVKEREVKTSLFVVVAGDRGLAGGYNSNVIKLANAAIAERIKNGGRVKVIAIGKKAVEHYEKSNHELVKGYIGIAEESSPLHIGAISNSCISLFKNNEVDEIMFYYTQFVSALSQEPFEMKVLPLSNLVEETQEDVEKAYVEYEPSPEAVFDAIIPDYVSGILYGAVVESFASEQGARRTAMESASDNANEMIDKLSLQYNRARQAAITQEISEIVSGANAL